jgi:hypothetical protein
MEPILIGFFPKRQSEAPKGVPLPGFPNVTDIASVGHYISEGPPNWDYQGRHNELWFFDSEALARKVIAEAIQIEIEPDPQRDPPWQVKLSRERECAYDFYAYKLFPLQFVDGRQEDYHLPALKCEPLPVDYEQLGYDVVNRTCCAHFECSPLFCNGRAADNPVNRFCLMDEPERALALAKEFSGSNGNGCEPGIYFVIEVWRKSKPFSEPARSSAPFEWRADLLRNLVAHKIAHGKVFER